MAVILTVQSLIFALIIAHALSRVQEIDQPELTGSESGLPYLQPVSGKRNFVAIAPGYIRNGLDV
jgi:hypothetical protein